MLNFICFIIEQKIQFEWIGAHPSNTIVRYVKNRFTTMTIHQLEELIFSISTTVLIFNRQRRAIIIVENRQSSISKFCAMTQSVEQRNCIIFFQTPSHIPSGAA